MKDILKNVDPSRLSLFASMTAGLIRGLHATCRVRVLGREHLDRAFQGPTPAILTTWHFTYPFVIHFFRNRNGILMVSRSRDGEWASQIVRRLGYDTVRGSSHRGGTLAYRQMLRYLRSGRPVGLIADGSTGPPRVAQRGILLLASHTGYPLVPLSMAADPCWRLPTWDRTLVAKPFSRIALAVGHPLKIPRKLVKEDQEPYRRRLEEMLNRLTDQAEAVLEIHGHTQRA